MLILDNGVDMDPDSSSEEESNSVISQNKEGFLYEEEQIFEDSHEETAIPDIFLQEDSDSDEDAEDWESSSREFKS